MPDRPKPTASRTNDASSGTLLLRVAVFCVAVFPGGALHGAVVEPYIPGMPEFAGGAAAGSIITPFAVSAAQIVLGPAADQSPSGGLRTRADAATPKLDKLAAKPGATQDGGPFRNAKGDIVVRDMVPALAVPALLVAGLLLREAVRRRRRTALARRIKQRFDHSARRRPSRKSPPPIQ